MITSFKNGSKISARKYAQELLASAVSDRKDMGCEDPEMTDRERLQVVTHLEKISTRILSKLGTGPASTDEEESE